MKGGIEVNYLDLISKSINKKLEGSYYVEIWEDYLFDTVVNIITSELVKSPDFNFSSLSAEDDSIDSIITSLEMLPFMEKNRYVLVDKIDFSKDGIKKYEDLFKAISRYCEKPNTSTIAFFLSRGKKAFKSGKYFKSIIKNVNFVEIERLNRADFGRFIAKFFKREERTISQSTISYLIDQMAYLDYQSKVSLYDVENELKKIRDIAGKKIDIDIIDRALIENIDDNIFHFLDALSSRKLKEAMSLFQGFKRSVDINYFQVFSMIVRDFRNIFAIKCMQDEKMRDAEIMKIVGISQFEYRKKKNNTYFSKDQLIKIYGLLYEFEKKSKTVNPDIDKALEILIAQICLIK